MKSPRLRTYCEMTPLITPPATSSNTFSRAAATRWWPRWAPPISRWAPLRVARGALGGQNRTGRRARLAGRPRGDSELQLPLRRQPPQWRSSAFLWWPIREGGRFVHQTTSPRLPALALESTPRSARRPTELLWGPWIDQTDPDGFLKTPGNNRGQGLHTARLKINPVCEPRRPETHYHSA